MSLASAAIVKGAISIPVYPHSAASLNALSGGQS
jgi:hypothetical protein